MSHIFSRSIGLKTILPLLPPIVHIFLLPQDAYIYLSLSRSVSIFCEIAFILLFYFTFCCLSFPFFLRLSDIFSTFFCRPPLYPLLNRVICPWGEALLSLLWSRIRDPPGSEIIWLSSAGNGYENNIGSGSESKLLVKIIMCPFLERNYKLIMSLFNCRFLSIHFVKK